MTVGHFDRLYRSALTARDRVRIALAVVLAAVAGLMAWVGLVWRSRTDMPLAEWSGNASVQLGIPILLALLLVAAAWLVRGVVLARLQVAVLLSLLLHLLLLFALQVVRLPSVLAEAVAAAAEYGEEPAIELPDYGGMEAAEAQPEVWQMSASVETPDSQLADPSRQPSEPAKPREQPTRPEAMPEEQVTAATRERVEAQKKMQVEQARRPEDALNRQATQQPTVPEQPAVAPQLAAERAAELSPEAAAATLAKQSVEAKMPDRGSTNDRLPELRASTAAAGEAKRADARPGSPDQARLAAARPAVDPAAAESRIDSPALAPEGKARELAPTAQRGELQRSRTELARGAAQAPPARLADTGAPRSPAGAAAPARSDAAPQMAGASARPAAVARSSASGGAAAAAGPAESPQVGPTGPAGTPNVEPARVPVPRAAAGNVAGPSGAGPASPSAASSGVTRAGPGTGTLPSRATGGDRAISPGDSGGTSTGALTRGSVGGGATAATGAAESVSIAETGRGSGDLKVAEPAAVSSSGRSARASIPSGAGRGTGALSGDRAPATGSGVRAAPIAGGSPSRGPEIGPQLGSDTAGAGRPSAALSSRATPSAGVPTGVSGGIEAEAMALTPGPQPGGGLEPGPQPGSVSGSGGAAAPAARASAPRRSAGLPGGAAAPGSPSPDGALSGSAKLAVGPPARRTQDDAPAMHPLVAQLARQALAGGTGADQAAVSPAFSLRTGAMRKEAAKTLGGSPATERAVELGIAWLAQHQAPDGSWSIHNFTSQCKEHQCDGSGSFQSDPAATGLALLAFLGAGYTHQSGQYQATVDRGLKWLVGQQRADGDLLGSDVPFVRFYSHGIGTIALCEAYGMTKDAALREPTQKALQFIIDSQHPELGGWRYVARSESDTSVSGWMLMALKSGEMAGFSVPPAVYQRVGRWLDSVERGPAGGRYAYHPTRPESVVMTAEGLLMRQYLGFSRDNPRLRAGANHLDANLPDPAQRDAYYWYYATQVMYHMQGPHWEHWNGRLRDMLVDTQSREGGAAGSWSPEHPTPDKWGSAGGRLYVTCLDLLMLEVYYRHLPLYQQLER